MKIICKNLKNKIILGSAVIILFIVGKSLLSCESASIDSDVMKDRIEHLVLFKFRSTVTLQQKQEVINRFMALNQSLKDGKRYLKIEYGFQNSKEGLSAGLEIGFRVSFSSTADRDYYVGKIKGLPEPASFDLNHDNFKSFVGPFLDPDQGVLVFDYMSNQEGSGSIPEEGYRLEHWVLFKFRKDITETEKQEAINRFSALKNSQKNGRHYISLLEFGYQNSMEGAERGFQIAFRVSFTSEADRNYYVGKPFLTTPGLFDEAHDDFKNFIDPLLDPDNGILVFDYQVIQK